MKRLSRAVCAELRARYMAKQAADERLASYLLGVLNQLDIPPEEYAGFDDETGEILLQDDRADAEATG